ncbi:carbonic anhydrase 6-like [Hermetia illucens]|uniref:carbonic anhydrase 6-like n=1 Tax=Hermetia illucens TaxID=343691 RepID=UPI0018CC6D80|nr:carbonic anhydrase 6-like [Hermetia illucens]
MSIKRFSCMVLGTLCASYRKSFQKQPTGADWRYPKLGEAEKWRGLCESGERQSPVHIDPNTAIGSNLPPLTVLNYRSRHHNFKMVNTGHGVSLEIPPRLGIMLTGGPLRDYYVLENIRWHWNGTEHTFKGMKCLAMEMHLVHRNLKYRDMSEALNHEDGVAVLGCLFKLSNVGNALLSRIFDSTSKIIEPGTITYVIYSFAMLDLLPPLHSYFTYKGSLTTPACNESVTWIIFNTVTNIHQHEIDKLSIIKDSRGERLSYNCRNQQPLNGRPLYFQSE